MKKIKITDLSQMCVLRPRVSACMYRAWRSKPAGWCVRERQAATGRRASENRRPRAPRCKTVRHLKTTAGQSRVRQQDPWQVRTIEKKAREIRFSVHSELNFKCMPGLKSLLCVFCCMDVRGGQQKKSQI